MKKIGLLNQPLSAVVAGLGHTDTLVIADAGLPIPATTQRIDLALVNGVPTFLETLQAVLVEMQVERAIIATEMASANSEIHGATRTILGAIEVTTVSHEEFQRLTATARAVVRTGECSPYANVILVSGVTF